MDDCEEGAGSDPPHTFHFDTVSLPCQLDILIFSSFHVLLAWFVLPKSGIDPSYLIIVIFYTDTIFVRIKFTPKNADFSR